jgi:integrase
MAVLMECPICHTKQAPTNKRCSKCTEDLEKAKRRQAGNVVRYWIRNRLKGKQVAEYIGLSLSEARDADGERKAQKRRDPHFKPKSDHRITFNGLTDWYLKLESVRALASYEIIKIRLAVFNEAFGETAISDLKLSDLENYQIQRLKAGKAPATVDHEIKKMQTVVLKAFNDERISGDVLRIFKRCKPTLKKGSDVRTRILSAGEFEAIMANLPRQVKAIFAIGYFTGMRRSEILGLTWDKIDKKSRTINLAAADTKDKQARVIPICDELWAILKEIPQNIHEPHLFQYRGKPISDIRDSLRPACKAAGVVYGRFQKDGFIFHDLRHTFNTNMRKAGVAESVIMAITGHSTREMFDRYNVVDLDDTRKAVHQLEGHLKAVH